MLASATVAFGALRRSRRRTRARLATPRRSSPAGARCAAPRAERENSVDADQPMSASIGAGAGGAVLAAELAEGGATWSCCSSRALRTTPTASPRARPRCSARLYRDGGQTAHDRHPADRAAARAAARRHDAGQLRHLLPHARARARALAAGVRPGARRGHACARASSASSRRCRSPRSPPSSRAPTPPSPAAAPSGSAGRTATCAATRAAASAQGCACSAVPTSAKQHTGITYIPRARAAGAQHPDRRRRTQIEVRGGRGAQACAAQLRRRPRARTCARRASSSRAGTIHTPLLLERSRLPDGVRPAWAQPLAAPRHRRLRAHGRGRRHGRAACRRASTSMSSPREGIMFEGVAGPPAYAAMTLPLHRRAPRARRWPDYRHLAQFGLMVSDTSRGSRARARRAAGRSATTSCATTSRSFASGCARMEELLLAAGAREVYLPLPPGVRPSSARAKRPAI